MILDYDAMKGRGESHPVLCCSGCGFDHMHLRRVAEFEREGRLQVGLEFECENCDVLTYIAYRQHKGETVVKSWARRSPADTFDTP